MSLAADPAPPPLEPLSGCQENFIEDVYPPGTILPKDFAFVPGGWTPAGSWNFHLFYIRQNLLTKQYHGGLDFTEKNLGHAVSNDLHAWMVLDTAAIETRPGRFDSEHVWAPHVVRRGLTYYLFYTGVDASGDQRIGLATSTDLVNWVQGDSVFEVPPDGWEDPHPSPGGPPLFGQTQLRDPFVIEDPETPGTWLMYYVTVARDYTPGMVVGVARSNGDFASWSNTFPLWATLHRWPTATVGRVESPHVFPRNGSWWLFYTANGDTVYGVSNPTSPTDTVTANWSQAQRLRAL
ncbi:MAG TPA: family 43 glycosylhydrolase, partial [Candidatus Eisenbacteria bacterium]